MVHVAAHCKHQQSRFQFIIEFHGLLSSGQEHIHEGKHRYHSSGSVKEDPEGSTLEGLRH